MGKQKLTILEDKSRGMFITGATEVSAKDALTSYYHVRMYVSVTYVHVLCTYAYVCVCICDVCAFIVYVCTHM